MINFVLIGLGVFVVGLSITTYSLAGRPVLRLESANSAWELAASSAAVVGVVVLGFWASNLKDLFWLAIFVGAIGGLVHEIAQSKGTMFFPKLKTDGLYLGAIGGMLLGGVAGLLVLRSVTSSDVTGLSIEAFLAGLALKGISEAAGTQNR